MGRSAGLGTESFGVILKRSRGNRGLTQEELAERAGLHAQEISKLERDVVRSPRSTTVAFLADALRLDAHEKEEFAASARGASAPLADSGLAALSTALLTGAQSLLASMP